MSECRSGAVGLGAELRLCLVELAAASSDATFVRIGSTWARFEKFAERGEDPFFVLARETCFTPSVPGDPPGFIDHAPAGLDDRGRDDL